MHDVETHPYDPQTAERQIGRTQARSRERDAAKHSALLEKLVAVAKDDRQNIMPITIEAGRKRARPWATSSTRLKKLWGTYRETPVF